MALTKAQVREILSTAGVDREHMSDAVDKIIDGHLASINVLREEADKYKADAEKLPNVQKELDDLKAAGDGGWEEKAKDFEKKYNDLVAENKNKETKAAKESAAKAFFESKGITGNSLEIAMRGSSAEIAGLDLDGEKIKDSSALDALVNGTFKALVSTTTTKGANIPNPPITTPNKAYSADDIRKMSPAEINKNWDSIKASLNGKGE